MGGEGQEEEKEKPSPKAMVVTMMKDLGGGSQYFRAKRNLDSPDVYIWGSNMYGVADPDSIGAEPVVKKPRKLRYFRGQALKDLKLGETCGAAITQNGDLVQWGKGYSETEFKPTKTLTGKGLVSLCMSRDRIISLSSDGKVYSLPIAKIEQDSGRKPSETTPSRWWLPFWTSSPRSAPLSYRLLTPPSLKFGEKVTAVSGGLEHVLLLTSSGRVFSAASSSESFPSRGQLGIPGLSWKNRPAGRPVDARHEVTSLRNSNKITQIAAGDYHSVALSSDGRIFCFGDNSFGQLGMEFFAETKYNDTPTELPLKRFYRSNKAWEAKATGIAAGDTTSFFTVDAKPRDNNANGKNNITADTWACGKGISGILGNGKWTHLQDEPTKVKALSGLREFDERLQRTVPVHLRDISVGATHASAVLDNRSELQDLPSDGVNTRGLDVLWWGGNEFFQLGTGKRSNLCKPTYITAPASVLNEQGNKEEARLQITPRQKGEVHGRKVTMEQRVECGRYTSAIYSAV